MKRLAISLLAGVAALSFISSAQAADLIIEEPAPVAIVDVGGNWDGVFVGAFIGAGWGTVTDEDGFFGGVGVETDYDISGWLVGVDAGANFTVSEAIVAGIVGDIAWSDIGGDLADDGTYNVDWVGSIRGRLGFDGGAFLPYVTAGVAFASATAEWDDGVTVFEDSQTHIGWTVGAGVEFAVADNISLDLLYRYTDYGSKDYDLDATAVPLDLSTHTVSAGVNFKF